MVDFSKAINHYVNQGGVLIYGASDGDGAEVNSFLKGIFGIETAQKQTAGNGTIHDNDYQINNLPDNSAINGHSAIYHHVIGEKIMLLLEVLF